MTIRVRVLVSLVIASAAMVLASCGHYTCGSTFGSSSCSTSGGGINGGGNGSGGMAVAFLLAESNTGAPGMASDELDLSTNTFDLSTTFKAPPLPTGNGVLDGGTAVVNLTSQKYLYIPFSDNSVFGYAIDGTTGALTEVPGSPFTATAGTPSIAADPAGRFLFVGDAGTGDITAFTINPSNGSLTVVSGSPFASGISTAQMSTDGQGKFLYATDNGLNVAAFTISQTTGAISPVGSPSPLAIAQIEGEKTGKFLLGISGTDSKIHVFGINSTSGAIAEVSGSPFPTVSAAVNIVVHPTGSFVYSFHSAGFAVEGYQINSTSGALTAISGSPFSEVMLDFGQFDQSGKFLFGIGVGNTGFATFGPYPADPTTGVLSKTTFQLLGFPGAGFAVSDLNSAP